MNVVRESLVMNITACTKTDKERKKERNEMKWKKEIDIQRQSMHGSREGNDESAVLYTLGWYTDQCSTSTSTAYIVRVLVRVCHHHYVVKVKRTISNIPYCTVYGRYCTQWGRTKKWILTNERTNRFAEKMYVRSWRIYIDSYLVIGIQTDRCISMKRYQ